MRSLNCNTFELVIHRPVEAWREYRLLRDLFRVCLG